MSVSRKQPKVDEDYEFTAQDYLEDKAMCQDRTGYAPRTQAELEGKAVDEKLPTGSQDY